MKATNAIALGGALLISACAHGHAERAMAPPEPAAPMVSSAAPVADAANPQSKRLKSEQRKNPDPTKANTAAAGVTPPN